MCVCVCVCVCVIIPPVARKGRFCRPINGQRVWLKLAGTLSDAQPPNGGALGGEYGSVRLSPGHAHFWRWKRGRAAALQTEPTAPCGGNAPQHNRLPGGPSPRSMSCHVLITYNSSCVLNIFCSPHPFHLFGKRSASECVVCVVAVCEECVQAACVV